MTNHGQEPGELSRVKGRGGVQIFAYFLDGQILAQPQGDSLILERDGCMSGPLLSGFEGRDR